MQVQDQRGEVVKISEVLEQYLTKISLVLVQNICSLEKIKFGHATSV